MRRISYIALLLPAMLAAGKDTARQAAEPMAAAVRSADLVQGKVNAKAKVFYLLLASCQDEVCREYGAGLGKIYREMKGKEAELILLSKDAPSHALKWAKNCGLRCPILPAGKRSDKLPFPYTGEHLPPMLVALDAEGRKLAEANAERIILLLHDWKKLVHDIEREKERKDLPWTDLEIDE